ncbi:MAG: AraC family transcriptional regulator [Pseudomonadota bacterium]
MVQLEKTLGDDRISVNDDGFSLHFLEAGTHKLDFASADAVLDIFMGSTEGKATYRSAVETPENTHAQSFSFLPASMAQGAHFVRSGPSVLMIFEPKKLRVTPAAKIISAIEEPIWNYIDTGMTGAGILVKEFLESPSHTPKTSEKSFVRDLLSIRLMQISQLKAEKHSNSSARPMQKALEFIDAQEGHKLSLEEIASVAGMSPYHFARVFRSTFGVGAKRYVLLRRIERAQELIAKTDQSLAEIAYSVGFSSQSHMTSVFSNLAGRTPASFRETRKVEE